MANRWGNSGNSERLYFLAPKSLQMVTAAMKLRRLLLGRKVMTNLDSILKSRDITLPTKFHLIKAMVFPVVMHGCAAAATAAKSFQLCPTQWDPIDGSPKGSAIPGILQARTLEWVAIAFSIWMWDLVYKESWGQKNWCFWTVVLEKTLERESLGLQGDPTSPS